VSLPAATEADQELTPTATKTVATLPTPEGTEHGEVAMLRGEYFNFFVRILLMFFF
jgi:hypothetical protein